MYHYIHRNTLDSGSYGVSDKWEPFRGKYPDPMPEELSLIGAYLSKFEWELDDFDESRPDWISLKDSLRCPNLRHLLIKFLRQVRRSKVFYFLLISYLFITITNTILKLKLGIELVPRVTTWICILISPPYTSLYLFREALMRLNSTTMPWPLPPSQLGKSTLAWYDAIALFIFALILFYHIISFGGLLIITVLLN